VLNSIVNRFHWWFVDFITLQFSVMSHCYVYYNNNNNNNNTNICNARSVSKHTESEAHIVL